MAAKLLAVLLLLISVCVTLGCETKKVGEATKGGALHNYVKVPIDRAKNTKKTVEERQKAGPAQLQGIETDE